ncbi:integral membrane sensor signal transduction histidine kinase [Acetonema longum DSM 6540]|uniref:histidine kinase n=1 Tax=Acetonema longum DSM 6540 TaxID=1009370 RepID=F7NP14_9FIRM|nr:integral membrane sensor signal transduction histidine kinase [Acetonema longum DSM 6540]
MRTPKPKLIIHAVMLVTLASMVFIYPFDNQFRFTLGVAVLSVLILSFPELPAFRVILFSGAAIVAQRVAVSLLLGQGSFVTAFLSHIPAFSYYVVFAVMFELFTIRNAVGRFPLSVLLLSTTDALSNIVELFFRPALQSVNYETALAGVILIALVRSVLSVYGYMLLHKYHSFVLVQDQLRRYSELLVMTAKLKTELFYLKKSSQDIETVMERSYWLYNQLKQQEQSGAKMERPAGEALIIARDIHEVKKDYSRVIASIEKVLNPSGLDQSQYMKLSEVFDIIEQNVLRYIAASGKDIAISFHYSEDFFTHQYYTVVSMLDNLIMNAIEACNPSGTICVRQTSEGKNCIFCVEDDGSGIETEEWTLLFQPGYSTKFSPVTGKMSTGLGLCHVKNLSEDMGGTVQVASVAGQGAEFVILIPWKNLIVTDPE